MIDPRYHINLAWHGGEPDPTFQASLAVPATPSRRWDVAVTPAPPPPVPLAIAAWKGKAALRETGLLHPVEAAVAGAGGHVHYTWTGTAEWNRDSEFLQALAGELGLRKTDIARIFLEAATFQS